MDICIVVPSHCIKQVEGAHLILEHLVCTCLRKALKRDCYQFPQRWVPEPRGLRLVGPVIYA